MNETEAKMILAILRQNYKNAKINDPNSEVALWVNAFGEYPAEVVRIAAEFHIQKSSFFPTIAEIRSMIPRAEILKQFEDNNRPKPYLQDPEREKQTNAELQAIIDDMIEREEEMYGDFLDFEV